MTNPVSLPVLPIFLHRPFISSITYYIRGTYRRTDAATCSACQEIPGFSHSSEIFC
jgi:hypothetical protein